MIGFNFLLPNLIERITEFCLVPRCDSASRFLIVAVLWIRGLVLIDIECFSPIESINQVNLLFHLNGINNLKFRFAEALIGIPKARIRFPDRFI